MEKVKVIGSGGTTPVKPIPRRSPIHIDRVDQIIISDVPRYLGPYEVTPDAHIEQILETKDKKMIDDVKVKKIPRFETSNESGTTIYIASEV